MAEYAATLEERLARVGEALGAPRGMEVERAESMKEMVKTMQEALKSYREAWVKALAEKALKTEPMAGARLLVEESPEKDRRAVQDVLRTLTERVEDLVAAIIVRAGDSTIVEMAAGRKAAGRINVPELARRLAEALGGRGGGRGSYASVRLPGSPPRERVAEVLQAALQAGS